MNLLSETKTLRVKKRNRINRLEQKTHSISHEFGRSTKSLWKHIIEKGKNK